MLFAIHLMFVLGILVCNSFLISVCMFIVSKALLISSATVIVRAGEPFGSTPLLRCCLMCVVPSLYNVVFVPVLRGCVAYLQYIHLLRVGISPVGGVHVFVGFLDGDDVSQLPYVWYYVSVKNSFQHAREECESTRAYVF